MTSSISSLHTLLQRRDIWRLQARAPAASLRGCETGFAALNAALHKGGWPQAALTELLLDGPGIGELQLLLPALARQSRQQRWQTWINPPFVPYAPMLAAAGIDLDTLLIVRTEPRQQLWACEQALRCAAMGAVLFWPAQPLRYAELRKLQVAAGAQQSLAFLFRTTSHAQQTSPAALRLQLRSAGDQLALEILKQRGAAAGQQLLLPRSQLLHAQMPLCERPAPMLGAQAERVMTERAATRVLEPIARRRSLGRVFAVRSERHATH